MKILEKEIKELIEQEAAITDKEGFGFKTEISNDFFSCILKYNLITTSPNRTKLGVAFAQLNFGEPNTHVKFKDLHEDHMFHKATRDEIMEAVKNTIQFIIKQMLENPGATEIDEINDHFEKMKEEQDDLFEFYKKTYHLSITDAWKLHFFFSPWRIVKGLTEEQVKMLIHFWKLRDLQKTFYHATHQISLPESLMCDFDKKIDRTQGVKDAIYFILQDLIKRHALITEK